MRLPKAEMNSEPCSGTPTVLALPSRQRYVVERLGCLANLAR